MEIPRYLAMTAAELQGAEVVPDPLAWMACHFSSYGTGLSNVPKALPTGAMLMLNDRTPICGHDAKLVAQILCDAAMDLECACILLDFQQPNCEALQDVVRAVLAKTHCPVGVSTLYAADFDCPVLVPPIMPHISPDVALSPWVGRELWLELSTEGIQIKVTAEGSQYTSVPQFICEGIIHSEPELHCHYRITVEEDQVLFHLGRNEEDQNALLHITKSLGVTCAVGLWQEMGD